MVQGAKVNRFARSSSRIRAWAGVLGLLLLALALAALPGCDDDGNGLPGDDLAVGDPPADDPPADPPPAEDPPAVDPSVDDLSGDWIRLGYPDCEGTLPLQELPVEQDFIYNNLLTVEQDGDDLRFHIGSRRISGARLDGTTILFEFAYSASIDAHPPLRYAEITVSRQGQTLDDGSRLMFQDLYESYGDYLVCDHVFERP